MALISYRELAYRSINTTDLFTVSYNTTGTAYKTTINNLATLILRAGRDANLDHVYGSSISATAMAITNNLTTDSLVTGSINADGEISTSGLTTTDEIEVTGTDDISISSITAHTITVDILDSANIIYVTNDLIAAYAIGIIAGTNLIANYIKITDSVYLVLSHESPINPPGFYHWSAGTMTPSAVYTAGVAYRRLVIPHSTYIFARDPEKNHYVSCGPTSWGPLRFVALTDVNSEWHYDSVAGWFTPLRDGLYLFDINIAVYADHLTDPAWRRKAWFQVSINEDEDNLSDVQTNLFYYTEVFDFEHSQYFDIRFLRCQFFVPCIASASYYPMIRGYTWNPGSGIMVAGANPIFYSFTEWASKITIKRIH